MEKISEMIERLCPEGVERVRLDSVCSFQRGKTITAKEAIDGSIPVIAGGQTPSYYHNEANKYGESVVVAGSGAYAGFVSYWNTPIYVSDAFSVEPHDILMHKYLFFYLKQNQKKIFETQKGAGVPHVHGKDIAGFLIPLPPLPIQQEIVRVLDTFTQLQSNLEAELAARQKQYEYYRDSLFGEDVETLQERTNCDIKTIGELGTITRGKRFVRTDIVEEGVPCIHYGDMYTFYGLKAEKAHTHITKEKAKSMRFAKKNDVVIVGAGENDWDIGVGLVWLGEEDAAIHDACYILEHEQNPMYISHFLRSTVYHLQLRKYVSSGKISSFSAKDLGKILIPIPSLQRQQEIVSILDTFESLITNLKQEIEARKKQYEYYREKLLTF